MKGEEVKGRAMRECGMRIEVRDSRAVLKQHQVRHMREWLAGNREDLVPAEQYLKNGMLRGVPLVDLLNVHLESPSIHWSSVELLEKMSNYRSIDDNTLRYVTIKAITLGFDHMSHVDPVLTWAREMIAKDYDTSRLRCISADVETVHITSKDLYKLQQEYLVKEPFMVLTNDRSMKKQPFPGILMCGNGTTWMLVIQFPIARDKNHDFVYQYSELRQCEIDFLADMPVWTGLAVEQDQIEIYDTIERVYGVKIPMPGTLSVGALLIANGMNLYYRNMVTVNLFVMGGILNKVVSEAENQWWNRWEDLPDALKTYCVGDIRFGFTTVTVLMAHLMESYFPDPAFMCMVTQETLTDLRTYIQDYVLQTLMRMDGKPNAEARGRLSPHQIVDCLREWRVHKPAVSTKREMITRTDPRAIEFVKLIPPWLMACDGGCRSGIQARSHALVQLEVLASIFLRDSFPFTLKITRENIKDYPDFRSGPEHAQELQSSGAFQAPSYSPGMSYPAQLQPDDLVAPVLDPVLETLAEQIRSEFPARIIDYVTKFPQELKRILDAFAALEEELPIDSRWMRHSRLYHLLRDMHVLLVGPPPPMSKQMWNIRENVRKRIVSDLAPIRGGFAEETIRELVNPDNMSNIQLSKLVTDIVPGRNKNRRRNKKAREAMFRIKYGEEYVTRTDRQRAKQRKMELIKVKEFKEMKRRALTEVLPAPAVVPKKKTTWQDYKKRRGDTHSVATSAPAGTRGCIPHRVTNGEMEMGLEPIDLRHKLTRELVPQVEASYDRSTRKQTGRGFGSRKGSEDMEQVYHAMTDEEKKQYLKSAVPAGWNLEFMAAGREEDDLPLQIHWDECQESLDI